jgi:hypothetical protein
MLLLVTCPLASLLYFLTRFIVLLWLT